ncbi:MAG: hypothetical protein ACM3X6_01415 [Patescibacteria group bacterium]
MLCDECRGEIAERFTDNEWFVLATLQRQEAKDRARAMSREDVIAACKQPLSISRLRDSIIRLYATGMIAIAPGRVGMMWLTPDGEMALKHFKK